MTQILLGIAGVRAEMGIDKRLQSLRAGASLGKLQGTKLVILSACESGSGEVKIGEGLMSLRRAFTNAGAESVVASHWQGNDAATGRLMTELMRRWRAGTPRTQAWWEGEWRLLPSVCSAK